LLGREQNTPTGRQRKIRHQLWSVLHNVMHVEWLEKLWILTELSTPHVPAACALLRWMTERIERLLPKCGKRYTKALVGTGRQKDRAEPLTNLRL
jgi:hypothetical protein